MIIPTEKQCLDLFAEYKVPKNILTHCLKVREVSVFLAEELNKVGVSVNVAYVDSLALLHDIFKAVSMDELKPNKFHSYQFSEEEIAMWKKLKEKYGSMTEGDVSYDILKYEFPEIALSLKRIGTPTTEDFPLWEEMIVKYADIRVFKEDIVSAEERIAYVRERYPCDEKTMQEFIDKVKEHEEKIFSKLSYSPEDLKEKKNAGFLNPHSNQS